MRFLVLLFFLFLACQKYDYYDQEDDYLWQQILEGAFFIL